MDIQEDIAVNHDMTESRWKQVGGQVKIFWGKIDDDDLDRIGGNAERLADVLQHKYGYIKQHADSQSIRWMRKHRDEPGDAE